MVDKTFLMYSSYSKKTGNSITTLYTNAGNFVHGHTAKQCQIKKWNLKTFHVNIPFSEVSYLVKIK
jgi:hypothetical protein